MFQKSFLLFRSNLTYSLLKMMFLSLNVSQQVEKHTCKYSQFARSFSVIVLDQRVSKLSSSTASSSKMACSFQ